MPTLAPSTTSTRRRSTRSPAPPSTSTSSSENNSRSPDATAYQLLRAQLEKEEWRLLSDRKGGFALVKKGYTIDDAVEGESILIEEGFTLQNYEQLFFDTMEEEELMEWTDRLPNHPKLPAKSHSVSKKKNRVSVSPSSDASSSGEEGYVIGGGGSRAASKKKGASSAKTSTNKKKSTKAKKRKSRSNEGEEEDYESDGEDGIPGGTLRRFQKELFDTWLSGKTEFDSWNNKQQDQQQSTVSKKSLKAIKAVVAATKDVILENEHENEKMIHFKKQRVDPLARKVKMAVEEYVEAQAAALKKDILEEMLLDDYPFSDEDGDGEGEEEDEKENVVEGNEGEEKVKKVLEDEKVDNKGAEDKSEDGSSDGPSEDEVEGANDKVEDGQDANADWTSAVIDGSDGNGSN